jgi:hypothetical protein
VASSPDPVGRVASATYSTVTDLARLRG